MESRKAQLAFDVVRVEEGQDSIDEQICGAVYTCLREHLGVSDEFARKRAAAEASGELTRGTCDRYEQTGLRFAGETVLDLGAGLGGLSAEIARRGGKVIALEPGEGWRQLASRRLRSAGTGVVVGAIGEEMPVASNSIDLIVSSQVLEHVHNPKQVIQEAFRVLKPGGRFVFSYENYLSFWEPHYRIRWLPLLPKPLGAWYLRKRGKDPRFLLEAVTYTTFPAVRKALLTTGFRCRRLDEFEQALESPAKTSLKWKLVKAVASVRKSLALRLLAAGDFLRRTFVTAISEDMRKP